MKFLPDLHRIRGHAVWDRSLGPTSIIIDAGAHRGEFSREIHRRFGSRCLLIEANPHLALKLQPPPGGTVIHAALSANDGTARFVFRANPEGGSISVHSGDAGNETSEIKAVSLATLLREQGISRIDLLKLDIEGAEFPLLEQTPDAILTGIGQITVEFHDFLPEFDGRGLFQAARARLEGLGFVCCLMAFRTHGDVLFLNRQRVGLSSAALTRIAWGGRWVFKLRGVQNQ